MVPDIQKLNRLTDSLHVLAAAFQGVADAMARLSGLKRIPKRTVNRLIRWESRVLAGSNKLRLTKKYHKQLLRSLPDAV